MGIKIPKTTISLIFLFSFAGNAHSENTHWFSNQYDATTVLAFGIPDTDYAPVVFNCDMGDETVRLFVTHDAPEAQDGQEMVVALSSMAGTVEFPATGSFQEIDDLFHLEAQTRLDQKLVRILSAGDVLQIAIEEKVQEIPLTGAGEAIGPLVAACAAQLNPDDIELKITNATDAPVVSVLFSESGVNDFDGDTYANHVLSPGGSTYLVIPNGKPGCAYDLRAEFDEDAERDPFAASQNLCEKSEFVITD